ncbi:MAG: hypothetical protein IJN68_06360 [Clostridia bacterium]|nr:hypothetical protein [Clostridia bacterium]
MDELKDLFLNLDDKEFSELIEGSDIPADKELASRIKKRLDINKKNTNKKHLRFSHILPVAAALCIVIAVAAFLSVRVVKPHIIKPTQPEITTTVAPAPVENPLMVAISNGNDDLVANLLTLPGLISQDALDFALSFADLLSYETIEKIAESVKEAIGSTGLDALLEGALFGDSQKALEELRKRDSMLMTPLEKLAFFFAVAFCDSEVVEEFINRGYDINTTDSRGNTIYAIAEKYGNTENMQYAVSKGITN